MRTASFSCHRHSWQMALGESHANPLKLTNILQISTVSFWTLRWTWLKHVCDLESFWATLLRARNLKSKSTQKPKVLSICTAESLNRLDVFGTEMVWWRHLRSIYSRINTIANFVLVAFEKKLWHRCDSWGTGGLGFIRSRMVVTCCHKVSLSFKSGQIDFSLCRSWWFLPLLPPFHNQDGLDDGCGESETWSRESTWRNLTMNDLIFLIATVDDLTLNEIKLQDAKPLSSKEKTRNHQWFI